MEPNTPTTTETIEAAPATPPATVVAPAKTFTQEELNSIVQKRLDEDRRARPAAAKPTPAPAAPVKAEPPPAGGLTLEDVTRAVATARVLERAATSAGLNERQAQRMEDAMRAANPSDVPAWTKEYLDDMGLGKPPAPPAAATATPPATAATTTTVATAPAAAPAAPTAHALPTTQGVTDIFQPGVAAALGPDGVRAALEKLWAIGNQMQGAPQRPKPPAQR